MTQQVEEKAVTEATDEAIMEAAFLAEFNNTGAETPVAATEEVDTQTEETKPEPATEIVYTAEQIRALEEKVKEIDALKEDFEKRINSLGGKFGGFNSKIDQLEKTITKKPEAQAALWTPKQREWLKNEFPEMYAGLFDGEPEAPAVQQKPAAEQPSINIEELVAARIAEETSKLDSAHSSKIEELSRKLELKALAQVHGDIGKVQNGQYTLNDPAAYSQWLEQLDAATKKQMSESWDSDFLTAKLYDFKTYVKEKAKKTSKQEMAVVTRGLSRPSVSSSDEDEEEAAFNKEFYRR